jgi:hypothetical protein
MSPEVRENVVAYPPHVIEDPAEGRGLTYMGRRRIDKSDRNGDPLDGLVNLWDVALVLAVAFLLAALTGLGLSGILVGENMTIVKNPGEPDMQVITKQGATIQTYDLQSGTQATGMGTLIGQFYRLADGTTVYVPTGATAPSGASPSTVPTTAPGATPSVAPYATPTPSGLYPSPAATAPALPTVPSSVPTTGTGKKAGGSAGTVTTP